MRSRNIAAVAAMLLSLTPRHASAYDCSELMTQLDTYPASLKAFAGRAQAIIATLSGAAPMREKLNALAASRPMLDSTIVDAGRMLLIMDAGMANGCVPQGATAEFFTARENVINILAAVQSGRMLADIELKKVGM